MKDDKWIDLSLTLKSNMVHWPTDPSFSIERVRDMDKGDTVNLSKITMGAHSGTHVDAPVHFIKGAKGVDRLLFDSLIGPARIVGIADADTIKEKELAGLGIKKGERILLRTRNSLNKLLHKNTFTEDFVYIEKDAAEFLATCGIKTLGVDYLSVGGYKKNGPDVHRLLLGAGILVIEGLDLNEALPGNYDMICLPMKILDSDGAPARMIVKITKAFDKDK
ncbi:MAG: cyclase family protein [Syntrophales bacterium]|jgi:arylformamidase